MMTSLLVAAALQAAQPRPPYGPLDWLASEWSCRAEMLASGPVWRRLEIHREGGGLSGSIGLGHKSAPEVRLRIAGETLRLTHPPHYDVATEYRLVSNDRGGAVFETRARRTVPQRVAFQLWDFGITVTMSQRDGRLAATTYYFRPGLHTGTGGCDGRIR